MGILVDRVWAQLQTHRELLDQDGREILVVRQGYANRRSRGVHFDTCFSVLRPISTQSINLRRSELWKLMDRK